MDCNLKDENEIGSSFNLRFLADMKEELMGQTEIKNCDHWMEFLYRLVPKCNR